MNIANLGTFLGSIYEYASKKISFLKYAFFIDFFMCDSTAVCGMQMFSPATNDQKH